MNAVFPEALGPRFEPLRPLGEGAYGAVFLAQDRKLGRRVAIKVLAGGAGDPVTRARFGREARLTSGIKHPHVVGVLDFEGEEDGSPAWIAYEFVAGPTLLELAREAPGVRPDAPGLARLGAELAEALAAVHRAGVLHRDVKPGNILVRADGSAVLCDFGLARDPRAGTVLTQEGLVVGTPAYLAPELLLGEAASPASDQWALGATLFYGLYLRIPFEVASVPDLFRVARAGEPVAVPPPGARGHPGLDAVVARALAQRPRDRFPDLDALARALRHLAEPGDPRSREPWGDRGSRARGGREGPPSDLEPTPGDEGDSEVGRETDRRTVRGASTGGGPERSGADPDTTRADGGTMGPAGTGAPTGASGDEGAGGSRSAGGGEPRTGSDSAGPVPGAPRRRVAGGGVVLGFVSVLGLAGLLGRILPGPGPQAAVPPTGGPAVGTAGPGGDRGDDPRSGDPEGEPPEWPGRSWPAALRAASRRLELAMATRRLGGEPAPGQGSEGPAGTGPDPVESALAAWSLARHELAPGDPLTRREAELLGRLVFRGGTRERDPGTALRRAGILRAGLPDAPLVGLLARAAAALQIAPPDPGPLVEAALHPGLRGEAVGLVEALAGIPPGPWTIRLARGLEAGLGEGRGLERSISRVLEGFEAGSPPEVRAALEGFRRAREIEIRLRPDPAAARAEAERAQAALIQALDGDASTTGPESRYTRVKAMLGPGFLPALEAWSNAFDRYLDLWWSEPGREEAEALEDLAVLAWAWHHSRIHDDMAATYGSSLGGGRLLGQLGLRYGDPDLERLVAATRRAWDSSRTRFRRRFGDAPGWLVLAEGQVGADAGAPDVDAAIFALIESLSHDRLRPATREASLRAATSLIRQQVASWDPGQLLELLAAYEAAAMTRPESFPEALRRLDRVEIVLLLVDSRRRELGDHLETIAALLPPPGTPLEKDLTGRLGRELCRLVDLAVETDRRLPERIRLWCEFGLSASGR